TPEHEQYARASGAFELLDAAKMPYVLTIGNHDSAAVKEGGSAAPGNVNLNLRNTATFNEYFPLSRFPLLQGTYEPGKIDTAYPTFRPGGVDWLVINLELWARTGPLDWAASVVEAHPHHNVIVLTHALTTARNEIQPNNGGYGDNKVETILDRLVYR